MKIKLLGGPLLIVLGAGIFLEAYYFACDNPLYNWIYFFGVLIPIVLGFGFLWWKVSWPLKLALLLGLALLVSSILLASMSSARNNPLEATIWSQHRAFALETLLFEEREGSFSGVCELLPASVIKRQQSCEGPLFQRFMTPLSDRVKTSCNASAEAYAVETFVPTTGTYVCSDSSGNVAIDRTTSIGRSLSCD